ncbi:P-type conjugative transfer protein VirB9 [Neisseriaceae bacterium ESL0693]|nr:P-type conjugative transfer protein VirB9 [Neisseriaceae bacterium ESL0693]
MMKKLNPIAAIMAAFILPISLAHAEYTPRGLASDGRVQTAVYNSDQVYHIYGQIGRVSLVQLEPDERLDGDNAALGLGDAEAWKVAVKGNNIIFKPTVTKPATNMVVTTNKRTYLFTLSLAGNKNQRPTYALRFSYPDTQSAAKAAALARDKKALAVLADEHQTTGWKIHNSNYYGRGDKALAPTAAWDDGRFTYLRFQNARDLPTAYKIMADGTETLVNSHIDNDTLVIHETAKQFVLRLGKSVLGITNHSYNAVGQFNKTGTSDHDSVRIVK